MNGKELKVVEYNLTFGTNERTVNVFGLFKYKKNNSLYVIYADVATTYNIIYYGSSHIKNNSILSMSTKESDIEIIKEYIYKITNSLPLDSFEIISLNDIEGIEIISSNRLEIKKEVLESLINKTIPKKEIVDLPKKESTKKKGKSISILIVFIILMFLLGGGYYFLNISKNSPPISKTIICLKEETDKTLNASIEENNIYNFNNKDILENIELTKIFKFNDHLSYQDFINKGTMYKYMPTDDTNGGYKQDDENSTFTIITKESVSASYSEPTNYEEVLYHYKKEGYTCEEKLLGE